MQWHKAFETIVYELILIKILLMISLLFMEHLTLLPINVLLRSSVYTNKQAENLCYLRQIGTKDECLR